MPKGCGGGNRNEIPWQTMDQLRSLSFTAIAIGTTQHDMDETWSETREKFQRKIATTTTEEGDARENRREKQKTRKPSGDQGALPEPGPSFGVKLKLELKAQ